MTTVNRQQKGQMAEQLACEFLQAHGLRLLVQNYRCYHGEIDLIMQDQDAIVFVEVRSRYRIDHGTALESINHQKMSRLSKAVRHFLQMKNGLYTINGRVDVIAIQSIAGQPQIEWIKNAFSVEY